MSNFVGQADMANLAHRHKVFTSPEQFNNYLGVAGEIAFLACNGYLIGALFNGVCPGGVARWRMSSLPISDLMGGGSTGGGTGGGGEFVTPAQLESAINGLIAGDDPFVTQSRFLSAMQELEGAVQGVFAQVSTLEQTVQNDYATKAELQAAVDAATAGITAVQQNLTDANTALSASISTLNDALTAQNALIADLQTRVTALENA